MKYKERERAHESVELEIAQEKAAALSRITTILTSCIEEVRTLEEQLRRLKNSEEGNLRQQYREAYDRARLYRYYLTVQREAIGIRNHRNLPLELELPPYLEQK